jgi:hypothetical protein
MPYLVGSFGRRQNLQLWLPDKIVLIGYSITSKSMQIYQDKWLIEVFQEKRVISSSPIFGVYFGG